jgi:hypothetical protein
VLRLVEVAEQGERVCGPLDVAGEGEGFGAFAEGAVLPVVGQDVAACDQDVRSFSEL